MEDVEIEELDWSDMAQIAAARALIKAAFNNPQRYGEARLAAEISPTEGAYYRQFFVARQGDKLVGVAGVKAADWATNTHILYLAAVDKACRGQGIGRALVLARLDWLQARFPAGRILVSTPKPRRFKRLGFRVITGSRQEGRWLMLREMS